MSPPPYYGNILRSLLGFHPHFMTASPFETPRAMIPNVELDDEIDFLMMSSVTMETHLH